MTYRPSHWLGSYEKEVSIPDHVPVGAVIGKGGSNCRSLRDTYRIHCYIDANTRKVALKGSHNGVTDAENELCELFATFAVHRPEPKRIFEVVARDGPSHLWVFQETERESCNAMVEEYRYRLQKAGPSTPAESQKNSWIQEFDESKATDVMSYLKNRSFELPLTTKLSFGQLCVKLISQRSKSLSSLTWPDLQKLQNLGDITTRWNNNCDRSSPAMAALLDDLEASKGPDDIPQIGLWVHFGNKQQDSWDLTLHLVDGKWKLHKAFTRRIVRGTYDIIHDDDISFRLRAVTREKLLDNDADNIQRHIDISIPGDSNFYDTIVTMAGSAPRGMFVKSAEIRSKVRIQHRGLVFSLSYLGQQQSEFRLSCHLPVAEKEKLSTEDNECQVLLGRCCRYFSDVL